MLSTFLSFHSHLSIYNEAPSYIMMYLHAIVIGSTVPVTEDHYLNQFPSSNK